MSADERVEHLLQTALYDQDSELVEGAFVDDYVANASVAAAELNAYYREHGFRPEDEERIRAAILRADMRPTEAAYLFYALKAHLTPLAEELLTHPEPRVRILVARAAFGIVIWKHVLRLLDDPDPEVRLALTTLIGESWRSVPDAIPRLVRLLQDPDPRVRAAAGEGLSFNSETPIGPLLVEAIAREPDPASRASLIAALAAKVRQAGIHASGDRLVQWVSPPAVELLFHELAHPSPDIRKAVAEALQRFQGPAVARALLERLKRETEREVRVALVQYQGFQQIQDESQDFLFDLLLHDPDPVVRYRVAFLLEHFGHAAEAPLLEALQGPTQRAAAMSLGKVGSVRSLPALIHAWSHPESPHWLWDREMETAVTDVVIRAAHAESHPPPDDVSEVVHRLLAELEPSGWVQRELKESHHALPLHATQIYAWGLRPDGVILCMDHESFRQETEAELRPEVRFAVMVAGAGRYPELAAAIPQPPKGCRPCPSCRATGADPRDGSSCFPCSGLGFYHRVP